MKIRIFEIEKTKFTIHPGESLVYRIANLLVSKDFCQITETLPRAFGHSSPGVPTTWSGLVSGHIVNEQHSVKDIVEVISHELQIPWKTVTENEEYLLINKESELDC